MVASLEHEKGKRCAAAFGQEMPQIQRLINAAFAIALGRFPRCADNPANTNRDIWRFGDVAIEITQSLSHQMMRGGWPAS